MPGAPRLSRAPTGRHRHRALLFRLRTLEPIHRYLALVVPVGFGLLIVLLGSIELRWVPVRPAAFWLFAAFVFVGELVPIAVPRRNDVEEITTSTTFAFALMLGWGAGLSVLVMTTASGLADLLHHKPARKVLFNVAQLTMTMGAAVGAYALSGGSRPFSSADLGPFVAAAASFFAVNNFLTGVAIALAQDFPLLQLLRKELAFNSAVAATLLAMSPVVMFLADHGGLLLVPFVMLPVAAVHLAARTSLEKTRLVVRLQESLAHLTELNRLKDEFVATVSHELRTPLTSIDGYIKTMLSLDLDEAEKRSFMEAAGRQSERLRRLIEQLLAVARLESGMDQRSLAPTYLPGVVDELVQALGLQGSGHAVEVRVDRDLGPVETDTEKVAQILTNLVENAIKHSPQGTRVTVRARADREGVVTSIEDEGPGIPTEAQDKIFDRFYQVDQSMTRTAGGVGLGLYICRRLAEQIGADLRLDRSDAAGSVFSLRIPWVPARAVGHPSPGGPIPSAEPSAA